MRSIRISISRFWMKNYILNKLCTIWVRWTSCTQDWLASPPLVGVKVIEKNITTRSCISLISGLRYKDNETQGGRFFSQKIAKRQEAIVFSGNLIIITSVLKF